jgi:hypothetical protein
MNIQHSIGTTTSIYIRRLISDNSSTWWRSWPRDKRDGKAVLAGHERHGVERILGNAS